MSAAPPGPPGTPDEPDGPAPAPPDAHTPSPSPSETPAHAPSQPTSQLSSPAAGSAGPGGTGFDHGVLKSLLGAWALAACSAEETAAVETHLTDCATCAEEALRLRDAVGLLHSEDSLDLDPMLRTRVLEGCLVRRPPRIPVPDWAAPYDAETARLDALLRDMADAEWRAPVRLRWFDGEREVERDTTVAGVIGHLFAVDGLIAPVLGLPDPLRHGTHGTQSVHGAQGARGEGAGSQGPRSPGEAPGAAALPVDVVPGPVRRTEAFWALDTAAHHTTAARELWRDQARSMVRHVSFAEGDTGAFRVSYGDFELPLHDAFLDRAFECWMHAEDIADAVDYPYGPPAAGHLNLLVDLAARQLPDTIAGRRRAGLAAPPRRLAAAGAPGRTLHLEVEGNGGGHWYIPLDSPGAGASPEEEVAHVALDGLEFCQLAAGHVPPQDAAAGQDGDREAIRDVLFAAASLSRL